MLLLRLIKLHANLAAFKGRTKSERHKIRSRIYDKYYRGLVRNHGDLGESEVFQLVQDRTFPVNLYDSKKVMVFFVPEHRTMSGGIFSIFSIASQMRKLKTYHGYDVLVMTRPNPSKLTYFCNLNFKNSETVYRIAQLPLCKAAQEIYLHIPEYASASFIEYLSPDELSYLHGREKVYINLLNQNIQLMPKKNSFHSLRQLSEDISQSVAHHAYFTQEVADKYDLPTLLLPAFTDLSEYTASDFEDKEKLIIYSLDDAPYKEACLRKLRQELPDYKLVEIRDITFDKFMEYATRCLFSITFGEGFDGYLAQPIHQGGIGFAVFNEDFFPSPHFKNYYNIFSSGDAMVAGICDRIRELAGNRVAYVELNNQFRKEYEKLYSYGEYIEQLKKLSLREFEIFPSGWKQKNRSA